MENTTSLVNCNKCKADNNANNDDGDSNADCHVCQLPGLQAQLVSSDQISTVNSMASLTKKKTRSLQLTGVYNHFYMVLSYEENKTPDFSFNRKQFSMTVTKLMS